MAEITNPLLQLIGGKPSTVAAGDTIAQSKITNLTTDLSTLTSDVSSAQADATQALSDAAAAQADATQALSDAAAAQSTADGAASAASAAQADATQALSDAAAAQADATQALSDAAAAQSTADGAASAASAAQADATQALSDAAAAQADATQALSDAAAAQSTADGAASAASAAQADATQALSDAAAAQATADAALPLAGGTLTGPLAGTSASFSGDVVVQGNLISKGQVDVLISDSFLDLNAGNVDAVGATAAGLAINVKASGSPLTATAFVAGVGPAVSAPKMTIVSSGLSAGDIVQVSGSVDGKNDGLFVVAGVSGSDVSIKGVGGTAVDMAKTPFVQNQFEAQSGQSATVTKVDLAVLAASNGLIQDSSGSISAGTFCYKYASAATESSFAVWTAITAATVPTLAQVLSQGSMIGADTEIGFVATVASAAEKGSLLYQHSDGELKLLSSAISEGELDAVALEAGGSSKEVASVLGQKVFVKVDGTAPSVGDLLYVSGTAGSATKAVPTSGRIIKVGKCVGAVSGGLYPVIYLPQYIADISA